MLMKPIALLSSLAVAMIVLFTVPTAAKQEAYKDDYEECIADYIKSATSGARTFIQKVRGAGSPGWSAYATDEQLSAIVLAEWLGYAKKECPQWKGEHGAYNRNRNKL